LNAGNQTSTQNIRQPTGDMPDGKPDMMGDKSIALLSLILAIVIWWWVTLYQLP
jgi:hypothetical protein